MRRMFVNACYWCVGFEDKIPAKTDVTTVGTYAPRKSDFGGYRRGVTPEDLQQNLSTDELADVPVNEQEAEFYRITDVPMPTDGESGRRHIDALRIPQRVLPAVMFPYKKMGQGIIDLSLYPAAGSGLFITCVNLTGNPLNVQGHPFPASGYNGSETSLSILIVQTGQSSGYFVMLRHLALAFLLIGMQVPVFAGRPATATASVTAGFVSGVTVTDSGSGYQSEPLVSLSGDGGSGAIAKAILSDDKLGQIIVLNKGSGYSAAPAVVIEAPPQETSLTVELVPKITVIGQSGSTFRIEWSVTLESGKLWQVLTNVTVGTDGVTVIDLAVGSATRFYRTVLEAPDEMALIPAGTFQMGDTFNDTDVSLGERPVHTVFVSAFYMDKMEVTKALWDEVKGWAGGNGYTYDNPGGGNAANHPVHSVSWYDVVKWCNARSQREGRVAAYYSDPALTQVYKTGQVAPYVKWNAGYRLPTEAEWEKAARGGSSGHRFPWSDSDTITHSRANYYSSSDYAYDIDPNSGFHPTYSGGDFPLTSPVGSFAANGYGLYDMAGNVWEWCWDWYGSYSNESQTDPRGPTPGSYRVLRGGGWDYYAIYCRSAYRNLTTPDNRYWDYGFRSVLPPGQP